MPINPIPTIPILIISASSLDLWRYEFMAVSTISMKHMFLGCFRAIFA